MTTGPRCTSSPVRSRPDRGPEPSDAELIAAVRAGTAGAGAAFGELYARHAGPARRLAAVLARDRADAEDLVAEAFTKVLATLRAGRGPDTAFRAYLLTTLRHACYDRAQWERRVELTADLTRYERQPADGGQGADTLAHLERSYAVRAFRRLPERWRRVLWHTEVDGEKPAQIAPRLGLSANAVAALAYRARERLRQMYLQEHLTAAGTPACHWTTDRLGAHVRRGLARRDRTRVERHLSGCAECRSRWAEVSAVNSLCAGPPAAGCRPAAVAAPGPPGQVVSAACG